MKDRVEGSTHWNGYILNLIIDREEDTGLLSFVTLRDLNLITRLFRVLLLLLSLLFKNAVQTELLF